MADLSQIALMGFYDTVPAVFSGHSGLFRRNLNLHLYKNNVKLDIFMVVLFPVNY